MSLQGNTVKTHPSRSGRHDRWGSEPQEIEKMAPTRRRWASECCGVTRSAICTILPEVIPLALVLGSYRKKERATDIS